MYSNVIFEPKLVDLQNYYFFEKGFSETELDKIYNDVSTLKFFNAATGLGSVEDKQ